MISVTHFDADADADADDFAATVRRALDELAARPGFRGGTIGRGLDDAAQWVLITEWDDVGSYRRALGGYEVKLAATPLLARARDLPSSFEALVQVSADGAVRERPSDRA